MFKNASIFFSLLLSICLFAQERDSISFKNGIDRPSILSTHQFGIFSSRINQNFKIAPPQNSTISINYTSGNHFHPFVEAYFPKDPNIRRQMSQNVWYERWRVFKFENQETTPADYMNIVIDAVIKEFRVNYNIPISKEHEIGLTLRSYVITKGKHPFSLFTSDETIEWFHSNVAGGEDPFGRRYYGLNQVNFRYEDRNGRTLQLNANDFFVGGLEFNHFYYPSFLRNDKKHIYVNFGSHLGLNTSKFNSALDYGISLNGVKRLILKNKNEINFGLGASVLHKNFINFKSDNIDLGNNTYLGSFEIHAEFTKYTESGNYHAFGINHHIQTRFNQKEEEGYYKLLGKWREINGGWQNGVATLYHTLLDWNFIYTYGRRNYKLSLFIKQDLEVNNAPDFQTGISLAIPIIQK
ncbi:hypothetical protein EYD45_13600 [Hyunsoonleella flava]|uniref:Porin n=1 Tax=Hyunsoonleella flava TaxID=2527939 RepID=A0A4V2J9V6_9FLAO|nr:hypothetical protein [Hyunsoonleella flava]TBN00856.1 hypothetical protein EYD45_13600 [Hyunsoonleella flava]